MAVNYSIPAITGRLTGLGVVAGGTPTMILQDVTGTDICTIGLGANLGTANGGVLTFSAPQFDPVVNTSGTPVSATIKDSTGVTLVSGLTVGIPFSGADVIISNGLNTAVISSTAVVSLVSAQITGS